MAVSELRALNYQESYGCPVCRHGRISAIVLMDAFACSFCRHIFTADLPNQSIRVEDSSQPMIWRWTGKNWLAAYRTDADLTIMVWIVASVLAILPASMIWLSSHTFPPAPGTSGAWLPSAWIMLTLLLHGALVIWLLAEHYQLPFYVMLKVRLQTSMGRRSRSQ